MEILKNGMNRRVVYSHTHPHPSQYCRLDYKRLFQQTRALHQVSEANVLSPKMSINKLQQFPPTDTS